MSTTTATTIARPRPYRRFLTSTLHARFVHASALVLLVCWNHAFFISDKKSWYFWSWFPLGSAGVRTIFIYISALFVFILHVGTLKIGKRQTASPFDTLRRILSSPSTIQPFLWYTASALWFSEVFIWCSASEENLGWIEKGGLDTPDKLNERPIYLRAVCLMLAIFQSCLFLYVDLGALKISVGRHRPDSKSAKQDTHPKVPIKQQLKENGVALVIYCAAVSATVAVVGPFIYSMTVRQWLWRFHLAFAKLFWNLSRANARATGYPPCNPFLMLRSFGLGFLLLTLWMATSIAFSLFLDQEPLKKGIPLSTGSKDPNGTLLNGLKAKRDVVKTFAFWELAAISEKQPERRKAIFADIERPEGPCWASMQEAALNVISQIEVRIGDTKPKLPSPSHQPQIMETLPSIAPPISEKQIVLNSPGGSTPRQQAEALIAAGAKRIGQSSHPWSPPVEKVKADLYERAQPSIQAASQWCSSLEQTVVGGFFVKTKERKINAVILGAPQSQSVVVVDATSSVTKMLVASLSEDVYGKVNKGVPEVVRTFTKTINSIEGYVQSLGNDINGSEIEDVLIVHALLKASLSELLLAFQMYLHDVGLGVSELNNANKAAQKKALIEDPPLLDPQAEMEQPPKRRQLGERQARRSNGQAAGAGAGSRKEAHPAVQAKPQRAQQKDRRPAQERLQLQDVEDEEDELEAQMPWSNPRRKLFDTASPPARNQDWLGNNMYNADTRQRRGFMVDSPA